MAALDCHGRIADRTTLDAWARIWTSAQQDPGSISVCEERIEIVMGPKHLERLETIVDPLVVPDLSTVVWSPHATVAFGSGFERFCGELSHAPVQMILLPAGIRFGSARR